MKRGQSTGELQKIIQIAVPVGLEAVCQMAFNLIDQVIVGFLGATAVAAVGLSNSVGAIAILLYAAIGTGSGVLIAQAYGRRDFSEISRIASIGLLLAGAFGVLTALPLILFSRPILIVIGAHNDLADLANGYFRLFSASLPLMIFSSIVTGGFRSLNDSKTPMLVTIGAVVLNTILGFLLVLGAGPIPRLGTAGAGLATLISQTVRTGLLVGLFYRTKQGVRWVWPSLRKATLATAGRLTKLTSPIALAEVLWGTSGFIYAIVFTRIGTTALAASQIAMTIENVFLVASSGLGPAAVAAVGQRLGTRSVGEAKANASLVLRFGLWASVILAGLFAAVTFILPVLYPKVGSEVLHLVAWGIIIFACVQPAKVLNSVLGNGVLASGGDTRFILLADLAGTYAIGLPAAVLLGLFSPLGVFGVFLARVGEEVVKFIFFYLRYRTPHWYQKSLKELSPSGEESVPDATVRLDD